MIQSIIFSFQIEYIINIGANDTGAIEDTLGNLEEAIEPEETKAIPAGNINSAAHSMADLAEARSNVPGAQVSQQEAQVKPMFISGVLLGSLIKLAFYYPWKSTISIKYLIHHYYSTISLHFTTGLQVFRAKSLIFVYMYMYISV